MNFSLFNFTFKKTFKSCFCWLLLIFSSIFFFLTSFAIVNIFTITKMTFAGKPFIYKSGMRKFIWLSLFLTITISIALLMNFVIDKKNLIFILSKHYNRINCLCIKILCSFFFSLFFICLLIVIGFLLNKYTKSKHDVVIYTNKDFLINFCLQTILFWIYNILFWSIITLINQKLFLFLLLFSQLFMVFMTIFFDKLLKLILKMDYMSEDYPLHIIEVYLHNVFFCPISFITLSLGIGFFYKMDLRI